MFLIRIILHLVVVRIKLILSIRLGASSLLGRLTIGSKNQARRGRVRKRERSKPFLVSFERTCLLEETALEGTTSENMSSSRAASFWIAAMLGV